MMRNPIWRMILKTVSDFRISDALVTRTMKFQDTRRKKRFLPDAVRPMGGRYFCYYKKKEILNLCNI